MKKRFFSLSLALLLALLALMAAGCDISQSVDELQGLEKDTGRVLVSGKTYLIVYDDGDFLVMNNVSDNDKLFEGLTNGDKIEIYRKGEIAESYPARCYVEKCKKTEDGSISDIPRKAIEALTELGWVIGGVETGENEEITTGGLTQNRHEIVKIYLYIAIATEDGFVGSSNELGRVYVKYPGANKGIEVSDTIVVEYYASDLKEEEGTFTHITGNSDKYFYKIDNPIIVRKSDPARGEPVFG